MASNSLEELVQSSSGFKAMREAQNGVMIISQNRPFAHAEDSYDIQYDLKPDELGPGQRLTDILKQAGIPSESKILEIGCGTGLLSMGLSASNHYSEIVVSDGSMDFIKIAQKKIGVVSSRSSVRFALMADNDFDAIQENYFDAIVMRSVLHHFTDFSKFGRVLLEKLKPGGVLAMYEPRAEMFLWMGTVAAMFTDAAKAHNIDVSEEDHRHIDLFVRTMEYYLRRDIDKSEGEDKYAFWTSEMLDIAEFAKARTTFQSESHPDDLVNLFIGYLKYCMGFPDSLLEKFEIVLGNLRGTISGFLRGSNAPDLAGWYVMVKPQLAVSTHQIEHKSRFPFEMPESFKEVVLEDNVSELNPSDFATVSYSQEGEDIYIMRDLCAGADGFFVDVGAHHPFRFSNTYALYCKGWRGINIDAIPGTKKLFDKYRSRDINVEAVVGEHEGAEVEFDIYEEPALNSAASNRRSEISSYSALSQTLKCKVRRLDSILNEHVPSNQSVDLLSIDVEGFDLQVLRSNDWSKYYPKVILVETWFNINEAPNSDIYHFLISKGYRLRSFLHLTAVFVSDRKPG